MKKILLTGATGGLGRCIASEIIESEIGDLVCIYRNQEKFDKIFEKSSHKIEKYHLAQKDDFSNLVKLIDANKYDRIILILNAFSILPIKRIGSLSTDEILQAISGNVIQNFLLLNRVTEYCQKNSIGLRIINIDSGAADFPLTGWGNYCASKAFINSMLSVAALENPDYQIVSFDPGVMDTDMQTAIRAVDRDIFDQVETFVGYKTEGRLNTPDDVAKQIKERYLSDWLAKNMREKYEP
ncbi:MAG: SDR family NAD(P)-dependent oxidoreductase [Lachnospiraceae bacterium]|nr:SDR family NAD(P)-dependent oxidoreductase [Lachnospiraceae bacterium]